MHLHLLATCLGVLALGACDARDRPRTFAPPPTSASAEVDIHLPAKLSAIETEDLDSLGRPVRVACVTCHSLKDTAEIPTSPSDLDEFHQGLTFSHGELACASCHTAEPRHAPELRLADGRRVPTTEAMQLCAQCHGPQHRDYKSGSHGGMNGAWDLSRGGRVRNHCVDCHDPHTPAISPVIPEPRARDRVFDASEGDHG